MSYDGIFAGVTARYLAKELDGARIERVQQPEPEEIILQVNTQNGRKKLLISACPRNAGVWFTGLSYENPAVAPAFCMLLRKHIQGGRISCVRQIETERIIELEVETVNEMGYGVSRKLIAETMGKHSNIILLDMETGKIMDSIKRISIDVNRYRQILPGLPYVMPPSQGKADFWTVTEEEIRERMTGCSGEPDKCLMKAVQGLGPVAAAQVCEERAFDDIAPAVIDLRNELLSGKLHPAVYADANGVPEEVHIFPLTSIEEGCRVLPFDEIGDALDYFYSHRRESNRVVQRGEVLSKSVSAILDKQLLKKQRLLEDLRKSEEADKYRLYGELLSANMHLVRPGDKSIRVISYYDGSEVDIPLDERFSASKNMQNFYKRYNKLDVAKKEKKIQLAECEAEIAYLESTLSLIPLAQNYEELELIRSELVRTGYMRARKASGKKTQAKPHPRSYTTSEGYELLVGRNNTENDYVTFKMGGKTDLWFHTKDIHGSHAVLLTRGEEVGEKTIFEAAAIAAWFSKGRDSGNVPVDYVPLRYVKKPAGAKPGMVIFTNNRTVWVDPADPEKKG